MKYHVEKSIKINKPLSEVKSHIEDFAKWKSWSPWTVVEPAVNQEFTGQAGQIGHAMSWQGEITGAGTMTLSKNEGGVIDIDLQFTKPFKAQAVSGFQLAEEGGGTKILWTMDGAMPFFLAFMIPMTKMMIGMDYDRGLKMLKAIIENGKVDAETTNKGVVDFEGFSYVGIQKKLPMERMSEMKNDFDKLFKEFGGNAKHWATIYPKVHAKENAMTYIAVISDENIDKSKLGEEYVTGEIASGKMLEVEHIGSYEFLGNAWSMGMMTVRGKKMKQSGIPFEYYRCSPLETDPSKLKTSVFFPVKS